MARKKDTAGLNIKPTSEKIFDVIILIIVTLLALSTLYPFWYTIIMSVSTQAEANRLGFHMWTSNPTLEGYKAVLGNPNIWTSYANSIYRTILGTAIGMSLTTILAYSLSKKYLPHRNFYTSIIVFTMFFSGGLIPSYLQIRDLKMLNTIWAVVIPGAIATYSMIIIRNYFQSLPAELEESAKIDGANDIIIMVRIFLPISKPVLATVLLWTVLGHWNAWFDAMIYLASRPDLMMLPLLLRRLLIEGSTNLISGPTIEDSTSKFSIESLKMVTVIVAILPIFIAYPFVQKYFVKGIMIGSLKG